MLVIRSVQQTDNEILAKIIRQCFHDFKAPTAGTVYEDPATDNLYDLFHRKIPFFGWLNLMEKLQAVADCIPTLIYRMIRWNSSNFILHLPRGEKELVKH